MITTLAIATPALSQTPQQTPPPSSGASSEEVKPAMTTVSGTTGLWFVPTAEVLQAKKWSASLYRTNVDDGQGFTDVSTFPVTFAYGLGGYGEVFGSWALITRIDRDTRPLFFESTPASIANGTGGGILPDYPLVRKEWTGNKLGDFTVGGKVNFLAKSNKALGAGARVMIKLPVGDEDEGASTGKTDFIIDGIVSSHTKAAEVSGYLGFITRGSPDGYSLTNGVRWGFGAGFPTSRPYGLLFTAELFGENYTDKTITAPAGLIGADGSFVPVQTTLKNPVILNLGATWQHKNGFFVGGAASWNMNMNGRADAAVDCGNGSVCVGFSDEPKDTQGFQVRIGYHPGARNRMYVAAPPPPPPPPPAVAAPPPAAANRPPTVTASCDPCTVEVGRTATVTATAQDPDGDALTYQWTVPAGSLTSPTNRQTPWTAPQTVGPVTFTVTVNDGKGGTANATTTINVVRPTVQEFTFEDVHFEFDRYTLKADALRVLDEAIRAMQANPTLRITIEGHTDNIGTAEYNLALGERRATAVREYLTSRGVNADRMQTVSYGEERPKYDNSREETRRLNRRAALVVRLQSN